MVNVFWWWGSLLAVLILWHGVCGWGNPSRFFCFYIQLAGWTKKTCLMAAFLYEFYFSPHSSGGKKWEKKKSKKTFLPTILIRFKNLGFHRIAWKSKVICMLVKSEAVLTLNTQSCMRGKFCKNTFFFIAHNWVFKKNMASPYELTFNLVKPLLLL